VRHSKERAAAEKDNLLLEVENKLLSLDRRLPPKEEGD
jgi:hypothetical protein